MACYLDLMMVSRMEMYLALMTVLSMVSTTDFYLDSNKAVVKGHLTLTMASQFVNMMVCDWD